MRTTSVDLFRVGNAYGARLDIVRRLDVSIFDLNGLEWVSGRSGGISTFNAVNAMITGKWWRLPTGSAYDDSLLVLVNDAGNHWSWEPSRDMLVADYVADYKAALAAVGSKFVRV